MILIRRLSLRLICLVDECIGMLYGMPQRGSDMVVFILVVGFAHKLYRHFTGYFPFCIPSQPLFHHEQCTFPFLNLYFIRKNGDYFALVLFLLSSRPIKSTDILLELVYIVIGFL